MGDKVLEYRLPYSRHRASLNSMSRILDGVSLFEENVSLILTFSTEKEHKAGDSASSVGFSKNYFTLPRSFLKKWPDFFVNMAHFLDQIGITCKGCNFYTNSHNQKNPFAINSTLKSINHYYDLLLWVYH
jgi:hypothetical protein